MGVSWCQGAIRSQTSPFGGQPNDAGVPELARVNDENAIGLRLRH